MHVCVPCGVVSANERQKIAHLNGKRHHRRIGGASTVMRCPLCEVMVVGHAVWTSHVTGKKHRAVAKQQGVPAAVDPEEGGGAVSGHIFCSVCETYVHEDAWDRHPQGRLHQIKIAFNAMRSALAEAAKDKHGVSVSHGDIVDFGVLDNSQGPCRKDIVLEIRATVPSSSVVLREAKLSPKRSQQVIP